MAVAALVVVWILAVVLLLTQLSSPQPALLAVLGASALAVPLLAGGVLLVLALSVRRRANELATRLSNLERRTIHHQELAAAAEDRAANTGVESGRLDELETELRRLQAATHGAEAREATVVRLRATMQEVEKRLRDVDLLATRMVAVERSTVEPAAVDELGKKVAALEVRRQPLLGELVDSIVALASAQGISLAEVITTRLAAEQVRTAIASHRYLDALPSLSAFGGLGRELSHRESRVLSEQLRRVGYLGASVDLIRGIAQRFGDPADARAAQLHGSELAFYRGDVDGDVELPPMEGQVRRDVVVHVVGKALPSTQSGYTLRTQYTARAQARIGITPVVVAQAGASDRPLETTAAYEHGDVRYYLLGGPQRGRVPWDAWLRANVLALAEVVRAVRPAVLHVHSDFVNSMIALPVAKAYGIPVVNETRGFWEESWLSRIATAAGWSDVDSATARYGYPDLYSLRVEREAVARSQADAVVTLARVMSEHIEQVGERLHLPVPATSLVPNAAEAEDFPVSTPDAALRASLGIEPEAIVVGYISSIVEYEGIDTLVRAMFEIEVALTAVRRRRAAPLDAEADATSEEAVLDIVRRLRLVHPELDDAALAERGRSLLAVAQRIPHESVRLLVVGDGAELQNLRDLARELDLQSAVFTGRIDHGLVRDYYGLIDLFVVPRKRAAVTELVTPLKPFEALSTGRPCVFSDVAALAEIATDSGCVELFRAGDHHDLALTIGRLVADPQRLAKMSREGASWVRDARTWDMNARGYLDVYRSLGLSPLPDGAQGREDEGPASASA